MHIRAETYKHRFEFKAFKTVNSIIVKWKKFGTTRTLSTAGSPAKLSNWCVCVCVCVCVLGHVSRSLQLLYLNSDLIYMAEW